MEKSKFDLTNYSLKGSTVISYLKIIAKGKEYNIYEGAIGNNRFQYFKIPKNSKAGKLCKQYYEKYIIGNGLRNSDYYAEDGKKLFEAVNCDAIYKTDKLNAYLQYWNDCLTENEKLNFNNFYNIQHLEALKEWWELSLKKHIRDNESEYLNHETKSNDIKQWKHEMLNSIETSLKVNTKNQYTKQSPISSLHASELIKFYDWIFEQDKLEQQTVTKQRNRIEFTPKQFNDLFNNHALVNVCLNLLRETEKPCINDENEYLRNKGVFIVWFYALERKKIFNYTFANDNERADTLNHNFPKLNISASLFRQSNERAKSRYQNHFENEIAAIKG